MEDLISKYLHHDLTPDEEKDLQKWLEQDRVNRKVFENIVGHWQISNNDLEAAKSRVLSQVLSIETDHKEVETGSRWWGYGSRVAAAVLLALGLTLVWMWQTDILKNDQTEQIVFIEKEASYGQKLTLELPDGSIVKLNSGSKLTYRKEFSDASREVNLVGEAFFDVAKNENKPFKITSDAILVQVLGTSFNVKAYPDEDEIEVAVKTGKVEVHDKSNKNKLILNPSEKASYSIENQSLKKGLLQQDDISVFGWTDQKLAINDENLDQILKKLSRWYGVEFEAAQMPDTQKRFTAKFKNPSLVRVMESLSFAYEFEYEINENSVLIH